MNYILRITLLLIFIIGFSTAYISCSNGSRNCKSVLKKGPFPCASVEISQYGEIKESTY
ncbi:MAG: hypothetical protein ACUBOA_05655 [Candidatus Loosdrechtia sp.]|uniref:hypothetical protein n=1 Tax=Candidatus Loosdrechtia sp. TaxID=3101272 RepID=UPI003A78EAF4|nr:MAG: hypothetical protein QY305_06515 [Candidatus Jettenia sp. AMX2]